MKVLKFGGSSVGSAEGLSQVKKVVGACTEDAIVVVSALGGITDQLLQTARTAAAGDDGYAASLAEMVARHYGLADTVVLKENLPSVREQIGRLLDELSNIFKGVYLIKDLSPKTTDAIVSYDRAQKALGGKIPENYWHILYARGMACFDNGIFDESSAGFWNTFDIKFTLRNDCVIQVGQ